MENNNTPEQNAPGAEVQTEENAQQTQTTPIEEPQTEAVIMGLFEKKVIKGAKVNYVLRDEDKQTHNLYGNPLIVAEIDEVNLPIASLIIPNMSGPAILIEKAEFNQFNQKPGTFHLI